MRKASPIRDAQLLSANPKSDLRRVDVKAAMEQVRPTGIEDLKALGAEKSERSIRPGCTCAYHGLG
jgi:hypothetical protein